MRHRPTCSKARFAAVGRWTEATVTGTGTAIDNAHMAVAEVEVEVAVVVVVEDTIVIGFERTGTHIDIEASKTVDVDVAGRKPAA